jgi:chitodextrinase
VRATDAAGNLSKYSNTASATTSASADTTAPTAPSNLVAAASSSSHIGLTWTASTDNLAVTGYRVERCSGASCSSFAQIGTTSGATTFSDSGLTQSTSYRYRVRATDAAREPQRVFEHRLGHDFGERRHHCPDRTLEPGRDGFLQQSHRTYLDRVHDNLAVTGYRVERCSGASCSSFAQIGTTSGATTFSDSGLTASTSYRYRVRATDAAGKSQRVFEHRFGNDFFLRRLKHHGERVA